MNGLGMSIFLEGIARGEAKAEARAIEKGITLSVKIFKAIQAGEHNNAVIAEQCGCTTEIVEQTREGFGI